VCYSLRMPPRPQHRAFVEAKAKRDIGKAFTFLRDLVLGEEEPDEFIARKMIEEPTSPAIIQAIGSVMTPTPAPKRERGEAKAETPRRGPAARLGEGERECAGCRVARRVGGSDARCAEHS
jgi:hypothetical protein